MGGFVYFRAPEDGRPVNSTLGYESAIGAMRAKGMNYARRFVRDQFELHLFHKIRLESCNHFEFDNGDFIAASGTLIYKKTMGESALRSLYRDFCNDRLEFQNAVGHFAVWIFSEGDLYVFNDYRGMYQVYQNNERSVLSSAFVAVLETLETRTPNQQQVFEYLTHGTTYGVRSVLREISLLESTKITGLLHKSACRPKKLSLPAYDSNMKFGDQVELVTSYLDDYFSPIQQLFGDDQSIGLTGGYDSRLTLAHMRRSGAKPHVYVQGPADSADVRIAHAIAAGEGFDIAYSENEAKPEFSQEELPARIRSAYFYMDALPHLGVFNDYALVSDERRNMSRPEKIRLYGMGGEIFRQIRSLFDRNYTIDEYLKVRLDNFEHSMYTSIFDKRRFLSNIGDELRAALGIEGNIMTRAQTELAYPHFALPRTSGPQLSVQNERAHALVPYSEPVFTMTSERIPISYKYLGRFEAALIQAVDPTLAGYNSAHGYNFVDGPGLKTRIGQKLKLTIPVSAWPLLRRQKARMKAKRDRPFYLSDKYVRALLPEGEALVAEFASLTDVTDYSLISRALSLELVLSGHIRAE